MVTDVTNRMMDCGETFYLHWMAYTWIFFDCFNTLVDDFDPSGDETGMKPLGHIAVHHAVFEQEEDFHAAYIEWRKQEWQGASWHEVSLEDRLRGTLKLGLKPASNLEPVVEELMHEFHQSYPATLRCTPGAAEVLNRYGNAYKTGLISNFFLADYPQTVLDRFGLSDSFDFILDSAQLGTKKPGDRIYHEAMKRAGVHPSEAQQILFIGDNPVNDVLKPMELGMDAIHFDRSLDRPNARSTPSGARAIKSWQEFSL